MAKETLHEEWVRLREEQQKTLLNEVFRGVSAKERAAYNGRAARIRDLEREIQASAEAEKKSRELRKTAVEENRIRVRLVSPIAGHAGTPSSFWHFVRAACRIDHTRRA